MRVRGVAVGALVLSVTACATPDPEERLREFERRAKDAELDAGKPDADAAAQAMAVGERVDFSGTYLQAYTSPVDPSKPILQRVEVRLSSDRERITFELQPLKSDTLPGSTDPRPDAREPVGDPREILDVPFEPDGTFVADLGAGTLPAEANPISGTPIESEVSMRGVVGRREGVLFFCGFFVGEVTEPIHLVLEEGDSPFGAIPLEDDARVIPLTGCPAGLSP